jgi:hypothetical protein
MSSPSLTNVSRAVRYREIAENCRTWANEARTEAERKDFLDMARISAHAAAEFDKGLTKVARFGALNERLTGSLHTAENALWAIVDDCAIS